MKIEDAIKTVMEFTDLSESQAYEVAVDVMNGVLTQSQIGALLTALNMKKFVISEITGFARAMRERVARLEFPYPDLVDTCGTGGDGAGTVNVSTMAALVAAGAGCRVVKHGNRSVSSRCGSADLLEALGVKIDTTVDVQRTCLEKAGFVFLFAQKHHPAMKSVALPRKELGFKTIFNVLGPLTNPSGAKRQVLGVYAKELTGALAMVLKKLGSEHCLIVHGTDGLDEITLTAETTVSELEGGKISNLSLKPEDVGLTRCRLDQITGSDPAWNARATEEVLTGAKGPIRDITVLNAAAAIYVSGKVKDLQEGIAKANEAIDSGSAHGKLKLLRELTE
ncbi:MAG: anthranilate phosphoribosyltransferase [Candidatus Wallbacteria bacterium]|nr:anthranilate phosphoribosyltransferase [Candidatus Wallbacteria bacterium]